MSQKTWHVRIGDDETEAIWDPPVASAEGPVFVCAHGAGGHMSDRSIVAVTEELRGRGIGTVRFNFFYRVRGAGPDPMPRLLSCFRGVLAQVRANLRPTVLVIGGRSMGGRAASVLASEGDDIQGLLLLAYPLHPPGQPQKLRAAHLPAIQVPVLCLNGTRDPFCDPPLMTDVLSRLGSNWRMHWLEAADHSFHVQKRSGRTERDVLTEVGDEAQTWLARDVAGG